MTGNPWLDAFAGGVISTVAGFVTRSVIQGEPTKTRREFYRTGGFTFDEANQAVKDHEKFGFIPLHAPRKIEETIGRDICFECFYETSDPVDFVDDVELAFCPRCGEGLDCTRDKLTSFTVELYRDVPIESDDIPMEDEF